MKRIERAREAVITAWLDDGFDPVVYGTSFDAVRAGQWDNRMPVKIALAALSKQGALNA